MSNGNSPNRPALFKVVVTSTFPPAKAEWEVDVGDDPVNASIYTNLGYDSIAASMAKLGIAMSEHILGDSTKMMAMGEECGAGCVDPTHAHGATKVSAPK